MYLKIAKREFPGGPVVRTPCFHCWGPRVLSLVKELRSHKPWGSAKKKKKKKLAKKKDLKNLITRKKNFFFFWLFCMVTHIN